MKGNAKVGSETRFSRKFLVNVTCFVVDFFFLFLRSPWLNRAHFGMVWRIPLPCISQGTTLSLAVKNWWRHKPYKELDLHGRFRGEFKFESIILRLKATSGHLFWNRIADFSKKFSFKFLRKRRLYITDYLNIENRADLELTP